jgi:hypothetical protein
MISTTTSYRWTESEYLENAVQTKGNAFPIDLCTCHPFIFLNERNVSFACFGHPWTNTVSLPASLYHHFSRRFLTLKWCHCRLGSTPMTHRLVMRKKTIARVLEEDRAQLRLGTRDPQRLASVSSESSGFSKELRQRIAFLR